MKRLKYGSTKKGVASLYVVIFTSILFGVITLSFIRIMLSETVQSSNDDLSQSAYDSALAGVEDAKIAVNKYYKCLSDNSGTDCGKYTADKLFGGNCADFKLKNNILGITEAEVKIQESTSTGDVVSNNTDQAYTCVIINNIVSDYRSTLTSDTRTRVIPLGVNSGELDKVKEVQFRWFSENNGTVFRNLGSGSDKTLPKKDKSPTPPVISLTLLRTGREININDYNNPTNVDYSTMILKPVESSGTNSISRTKIEESGDAAVKNDPIAIQCGPGDFACTVKLETGDNASGSFFKQDGNAFLIVSLPYGDTITDFAVELKDDSGNTVDFENVQISVDATGRTNQLLRRVETRLDPSDTFFPYPDYEITLNSGDEDSFWKRFWITYNCWTENGYCKDSAGNYINNGQM